MQIEKLKEISNEELAKVVEATADEVERRRLHESAAKEIHQVLAKYNFSSEEFTFILQKANLLTGSKPKKKKLRKDRRASVKPKYQSLDGNYKWTGRGRPPKWVIEICETKAMSMEEFKADGSYKVE